MSKFESSVKNLCRLCSNTGLISIGDVIHPKMLHVRQEDLENFKVPIRDMISLIGAEEVTLDDGLPQFICTSCLFYLHHAYEVHLKIRESSLTFRTALILVAEAAEASATSEAIAAPQPSPKTKSSKKAKKKQEMQEINYQKIDIAQEIENLELEGHEIKLKNYKNPLPFTEKKCSACFHRCLEPQSFNDHVENCVILQLDQLFWYLDELRKMRLSSQIDHDEFILRAISALRAIQEKCDKFWEEKGLTNITISDTVPVFDEASAKKHHDYHKMKHAKYTNEFIMNDNDDEVNNPVKLHFANNDQNEKF